MACRMNSGLDQRYNPHIRINAGSGINYGRLGAYMATVAAVPTTGTATPGTLRAELLRTFAGVRSTATNVALAPASDPYQRGTSTAGPVVAL
jgi:hypothetical protein